MFEFYINLNESVPSITDWIQTIIGALGVIFLIKTLNLQAKATQLQAEVALIEKEQFLQSIAPKVVFELKNDKYLPRGSISYYVQVNPAFDFTVINLSTSGITFRDIAFGKPLKGALHPDVLLGFSFEYDIEDIRIMNEIGKHGFLRIAFKVMYKDKLGNTYTELIHSYKNEDLFYLVEQKRELTPQAQTK